MPKHQWKTHNGVRRCTRCSCIKQAVCYVGIFILWTYLQSDGTRYTGQAPSCTPAAGTAAELPQPSAEPTAYSSPRKALRRAAGGVI